MNRLLPLQDIVYYLSRYRKSILPVLTERIKAHILLTATSFNIQIPYHMSVETYDEAVGCVADHDSSIDWEWMYDEIIKKLSNGGNVSKIQHKLSQMLVDMIIFTMKQGIQQEREGYAESEFAAPLSAHYLDEIIANDPDIPEQPSAIKEAFIFKPRPTYASTKNIYTRRQHTYSGSTIDPFSVLTSLPIRRSTVYLNPRSKVDVFREDFKKSRGQYEQGRGFVSDTDPYSYLDQ